MNKEKDQNPTEEKLPNQSALQNGEGETGNNEDTGPLPPTPPPPPPNPGKT